MWRIGATLVALVGPKTRHKCAASLAGFLMPGIDVPAVVITRIDGVLLISTARPGIDSAVLMAIENGWGIHTGIDAAMMAETRPVALATSLASHEVFTDIAGCVGTWCKYANVECVITTPNIRDEPNEPSTGARERPCVRIINIILAIFRWYHLT